MDNGVFLKKLATEIKIRGFSEQTLLSYQFHNKNFLGFANLQAEDVTEDDLKTYLAYLISDKALSPSSVALARSALLFAYNEILQKNFSTIRTPKIEHKNPPVLSKDEIKRLISAASNSKSKLLIQFLYSSGLRVSECLKLRAEDIDFKDGLCNVVQGKGNKDRVTVISKMLLGPLSDHLKSTSNSGGFLFKGKEGGPLTVRNLQKIVSGAAKRAGINKKVTPHKLRHSFATHLLEAGVSIRIIQELLGHTNLQTTQIYTRVSKESIKAVKNPLDVL